MTFTKNSRWTTASMTFSPSGLPDTLPGEIPSRGRSQPNGLLLWFQNVTEGCNRMKQVYDAFCDKLWQHTWISKSLSQQCLHPVPRGLKTGGWKCARHRGSCAAFDCQASHCTLTCQDISPRCGNIEQCFQRFAAGVWMERISSLLAKYLLSTSKAGASRMDFCFGSKMSLKAAIEWSKFMMPFVTCCDNTLEFPKASASNACTPFLEFWKPAVENVQDTAALAQPLTAKPVIAPWLVKTSR